MKRPYDRLVRRAEDMGYTQIADIGVLCGLNRPAISQRVNGRTDWQKRDILALCKELEIPKEEIGLYFFPELCSPQQK